MKISSSFNELNAESAPDLLSEKEQAAARQRMETDYLAQAQGSEAPFLLYITGLPGAGKSTMVEQIRKAAGVRADFLHINFDDLRAYHPRYALWLKKDPLNAAARTDKAVEKMISWLCAEAVRRRVNVVMDDAAMGREATQAVLAPFSAGGYVIRATVIALPYEVARRNVSLRFSEEMEKARQGLPAIPRWVNSQEMSAAPQALRGTVAAFFDVAGVKRVRVVFRKNERMAEFSTAAHNLEKAMEMIAAETDRVPSQVEKEFFTKKPSRRAPG